MIYSKNEMIITGCNIIEYPISLLDREFDHSVIDDVLNYCLYKISLEIEYCMEDVIEYALKMYYNRFESDLTTKFIYQLDLLHVGKHSFYVEQSNCEINELIDVFRLYTELKLEAIRIYQMSVVFNHFGINIPSSEVIKKGQVLYNSVDVNQPMQKQNIKSLIRLKRSGLFQSPAN